MDLNAMAKTAWQIAEDKGLHENLSTIPLREATLVRLALIHTEVSEGTQIVKRKGIWAEDSRRGDILEGYRTIVRTNFAEELADILIRVGDLAEELGLDLNEAVVRKMAKNRLRPKYFGTPQEDRAI